MPEPDNVIDSHVHFDLIERHHPQRIEWLRANHCAVVSWSYFEGMETVADLRAALSAKAGCLRKHAASGLNCRYLAGVHPRSIPAALKPEGINDLLRPYLEDPLCLGIGEIGLETGEGREQEVFLAQLEIGRSPDGQGKVVGVHTPRGNKPAVTAITLNLLKPFADLSPSLVIDHCTAGTIDAVLDAGLWAGVTLSPVKTSWDQMKAIVAKHRERIDRIMVNTDSGSAFFEDAVKGRRNPDLPAEDRDKIFYRNALSFFRLPHSDRRT